MEFTRYSPIHLFFIAVSLCKNNEQINIILKENRSHNPREGVDMSTTNASNKISIKGNKPKTPTTSMIKKQFMITLLEQTGVISFKKDSIYFNNIRHVHLKVKSCGEYSYATIVFVNLLDMIDVVDCTNENIRIEVYDNDSGGKLVYSAEVTSDDYTVVTSEFVAINSACAEIIKYIETVLTGGTYPYLHRK